MPYFLFIPPGLTAYQFNFNFEQLADFLYAIRPCLLYRWLTCKIEFAKFSTLMALPSHKPTVFVTSHHGLWPTEKLNQSMPMAYPKKILLQASSWPSHPMSKIKFLLTFLLPAHAMASMHSPQLVFTTPTDSFVMSYSR